MPNDQDKLRPEDAAVSHIQPTAEKDAPKNPGPPSQASPQQNAGKAKDDDKGAVGLDALNP